MLVDEMSKDCSKHINNQNDSLCFIVLINYEHGWYNSQNHVNTRVIEQ